MEIMLLSGQRLSTESRARWVLAPNGGLEVADIVNISASLEGITTFGGPPRCRIMISYRDGYGYNAPAIAMARRGLDADMRESSSYRSPSLSFDTMFPYPAASFSTVGVQFWDESEISVRCSIYGLPCFWSITPGETRELAILVDFHLALMPIVPVGLGPALAVVAHHREEKELLDAALSELGLSSIVTVAPLERDLRQCWVGQEPVRSMRPDLRYSAIATLIAIAANRTATERSYIAIGILEYPEIGFRSEVVIRTVLACQNMRWIIISRQEPPPWAELPVTRWEAEV